MCEICGPGTELVRFSLGACLSAAMRPAQSALSKVVVQEASDSTELRDWSQSMDDPFLGEWELNDFPPSAPRLRLHIEAHRERQR
jgi:hypothetical protein